MSATTYYQPGQEWLPSGFYGRRRHYPVYGRTDHDPSPLCDRTLQLNPDRQGDATLKCQRCQDIIEKAEKAGR